MSRALLACLLAVALVAAPPSRADAPDAAAGATLDRSVRFLQDAQNLDGGFGGRIGQPSDPDFSAWAAYALAAAGINPQDQAKPGGTDVHTYLTRNTAGLSQTTDFDRVALVALASGTSPSAFGGVDPLSTILSRQLSDGSFPQIAGSSEGWINSTIWSIFPLSAIDRPDTDAAVQRAVDWLIAQQRPDGSWPSFSPSSWSDADMTGAAIQALNAAGRHATAAEERAFEYLRGAQGEDGGFEATPGSGSNSATTAWVVQGMWAAGQDPRSWQTTSGNEPLAYLASLQRPDGSIGWTASDDTNSLWMTAQVGPALAGRPYPLPPVPRRVEAPPRAADEQVSASAHVPPASHRGQGGFQLRRGAGVIAGGGGRGAPLFSAPQPQSGGATARGSRQVEATSAESAPPRTVRPHRVDSSLSDVGGVGVAGETRGSGAGGTVEGLLVGGDGSSAPAAPGLAGAGSGGNPQPGVLIALLGALLAAMAIGSRRERAGVRTA
ncbi:MAG TPA: prenyltransferase/squalene oxidase repeat-containing protein [Solirubrobacterales bacterium]|nr:prenyltransferase/squalene oxidase repeat-containing protein [Solirubrobacterales bacterium]